MSDFLVAHKLTSKNEGGYADVEGDNGGETYAGITRKNFPHWPGWAIVDAKKPLEHNERIQDGALHEMINAFYKKEFWDKVGGDALEPQDLANQVYDMAVNAGVGTALKLLKES